jgi:hypothetical protein
MKAEREISEIHDLTGKVAQHYIDKYGNNALQLLEEAAKAFETNEDLSGCNRLLRLRDEILVLQMQDLVE